MVTKFSFGTLLMLTPLVRVYTRPSSPTVIMPLSPWFSTIRPHNFETSSIDVVLSLVLDAVRVYRDCCTGVQVEMLQRDVSGTNLIPTPFSILLTSLTFASSSSHHVRHLAQLWRTFCIDLSGMGFTPLFASIYQNTSGQLSVFFHHSTALTSPFSATVAIMLKYIRHILTVVLITVLLLWCSSRESGVSCLFQGSWWADFFTV